MDITKIISIPLAWLLELCYNLVHNYGVAILLFTLLTKIILLPVSLWVQKNSVVMVKMTPLLNKLKIKYYGDKDAIAEHTQTLYKKERYSPIASIIPMLVQIVMLLGVIGAVRTVMAAETESVLTQMPSAIGGIAWLMPLGAGLAATLLGLAQNKLNPLQREQKPAEQWLSNGFSILISLVLGAYVSLGVGIYWIASNLLSILQQWLLNRIIRPEKYIDYTALAESKKELAEMQGIGGKVSAEDKKREKADYKRFFSVGNKHLVFYSEKSGFYKYFSDVMDYILKNSNIIIHYVTSDPVDQIFSIAESEPRIKPYYIGENRLITLFMKMDVDIVVMTCPDLGNFHLKRSMLRKDIEYIYMFHYPLSTHMVLRTGALDHYDTVFCVGDFQFDEIRAAERVYGSKEKKLVAAGYGQLEQLYESYQNMSPVKREHPKVLLAPSWQPDNYLDSCLEELLTELSGKGFALVLRPHPEYVKRFGPKMDAIVKKFSHLPDITFELDFTSNTSIFDSDVLITDWSGTAYEFSFVTGKPSVFINTPPKVNNPEYKKLDIEPLEFSLRDKVGITVDPDKIPGLADNIKTLLLEGDKMQAQILALREKLIAHFGESGKVGARYIFTALTARQKEEEK